METGSFVIGALVGTVAGSVIGFLLARRFLSGSTSDVSELDLIRSEKEVLNRELQDARVGLAGAEAGRKGVAEERDRLVAELTSSRSEASTLNGRLEASIEKFKNQEERLVQQKSEFEELNKRFNTEFENLANRILEEKSKTFTEKNKENIDAILSPLRERIKDFEEKVERNYGEEKKEKAELKGEIKKLMELNQRISEEANNLATALKGDSKKQGNWGELILERIMESSGLQKDVEYRTQFSAKSLDDDILRPDVVVMLPDDKHLIIDSKVSLVAYDRFVNSDDADEQVRQLKAHIDSVKLHVKQLSEKAYHTARGMDTPEFVLMFMPIESSFSQAVKADNELFTYAWEKQVVIVSPSTLLATLRTVSAIWKQERQTRNALDIASKSGQLYDKFVGFAEDLLKIGRHLGQTQTAYTEATKKLSEGTGNIVRRTEELRKLGAKTSKRIPQELLTDTFDADADTDDE
ncbi:MAG: DNA recombination protein RmuC [Flavobacteriales bacterium]|nr:DNA recombination protein RmuC [Flavobacteriales bacterium]